MDQASIQKTVFCDFNHTADSSLMWQAIDS